MISVRSMDFFVYNKKNYLPDGFTDAVLRALSTQTAQILLSIVQKTYIRSYHNDRRIPAQASFIHFCLFSRLVTLIVSFCLCRLHKHFIYTRTQLGDTGIPFLCNNFLWDFEIHLFPSIVCNLFLSVWECSVRYSFSHKSTHLELWAQYSEQHDYSHRISPRNWAELGIGWECALCAIRAHGERCCDTRQARHVWHALM